MVRDERLDNSYEEKSEELQKLEYSYRQTFESEHGRIVLNHILQMCGFMSFRHYDTDKGMIAGAVAENLAKKILYHYGVWKRENFQRIPQFYPGKILDLPYVETAKERSE